MESLLKSPQHLDDIVIDQPGRALSLFSDRQRQQIEHRMELLQKSGVELTYSGGNLRVRYRFFGFVGAAGLQIGAGGRTIDLNLPFRSAANRANPVIFRRTIAF